jgi:hypothetical protein
MSEEMPVCVKCADNPDVDGEPRLVDVRGGQSKQRLPEPGETRLTEPDAGCPICNAAYELDDGEWQLMPGE